MKEQLYNDFKTNVLPLVSEGLTMTQEYFTDLFGRYIKYLIVTDLLGLLVSLLFVGIGCYVTYGMLKKGTKEEDDVYYLVATLLSVLIVIFFMVLFYKTENLIKAIYVPEVRIYEELSPIIKK